MEKQPALTLTKKPSRYALVLKGTKEHLYLPESSNLDNIKKLRVFILAFLNREDGKGRTLDDISIINVNTNGLVSETKHI